MSVKCSVWQRTKHDRRGLMLTVSPRPLSTVGCAHSIEYCWELSIGSNILHNTSPQPDNQLVFPSRCQVKKLSVGSATPTSPPPVNNSSGEVIIPLGDCTMVQQARKHRVDQIFGLPLPPQGLSAETSAINSPQTVGPLPIQVRLVVVCTQIGKRSITEVAYAKIRSNLVDRAPHLSNHSTRV